MLLTIPGFRPTSELHMWKGPFWNLPLHTASSVEECAAFLDKHLTEYAHIIGESLGGLVALAAKSPFIASVILVDTPLSMAKQWHVQQGVREAALANHPQMTRIADRIFGVFPDRQEERDYTHLLNVRRPVLALCSDIPLMPPRPFDLQPSCVDAADRKLMQSAGFDVRIVSGPHTLLSGATAECERLVDAWSRNS